MERPERLDMQSADGTQLNLDALYQIAPSCFTEATDPKTGKIKRVVNFDVLRQLLGDDTIEDATEAYEFNWVGKQDARAEVLRPINKTLRPVKEDSVDWDNTQNLYIEGDNLEVLKLLQNFSGSATTAHAVMLLNAEDSGNRKFIMVQLPEETDENSEAYKAGYKNICEIGKERIRRVAKKIKEEHPEAKDLDTGFRVFRVDESNFEDVERTPKEYNQDQLDLFLNNVKSDRTDLDLLFGCMLDWGVQLSLPMSSEEVDGKMIYTVNDGDLVACFADKVTDSVVKAMADKQPLRVIFRDSCFEQDADKINI